MKAVLEVTDRELVEHVARALASEGFRADSNMTDRDGFELWSLAVPEEDFEKAAARVEAIVEDYVPQEGALPRLTCPRCGSKRAGGESLSCEGALLSSAFSSKCLDCGHEWIA